MASTNCHPNRYQLRRHGMTLNQTCYLASNSGPGNFGAWQETSPKGLPRVLQFSIRFAF